MVLIHIFENIRGIVLRYLAVIYVAMMLPIIVLHAILLPSMQGADEANHFLRAVQFSHGHIVGVRQNELNAGGWVNEAALQFSTRFKQIPCNMAVKLDRSQYAAASELRWKGQAKVFANFCNTVMYPPVFYLPSTLAIRAGRILNLRVADTLIFARIVNGLVCAILGAIALTIARQGRAIMFTILSLPMTLSLFGYVTQDGLIIATFALVVAFLCSLPLDSKLSLRTSAIIAMLLGAIAAAKLPYLAFVLLLASSLFMSGENKWTVKGRQFTRLSMFALLVFGLWVVFGLMPAKVSFKPDSSVSSSGQIHFLLSNPLAFVKIFSYTIYLWAENFLQQFIGILGWLDTPLPKIVYSLATIAILLAISIDLLQDNVFRPLGDRLIAGLAMLIAIVLTFLALYLEWTKVGQNFVDGVQGRYLIPPALLLSIIIPNYVRRLHPVFKALQGVGWVILLALIWICELAVPVVLCTRYYWP